MRKITYKRFVGTSSEGSKFEQITLEVPYLFDVVRRYLRLHGLHKYVHDYCLSKSAWGWYITLDNNSIILEFVNPALVLNEINYKLVLDFNTKAARKVAVKLIRAHLEMWH